MLNAIQPVLHQSIYPLFAALVDPSLDIAAKPPTPAATDHVRDVVLIVGIGAVLALALFLFAYVTRRKRQGLTQSGSRVIYRAEKRTRRLENPEEGDYAGKRKLRKKRRRSEEFDHRNPTLGETGGLPPLRVDEPVEPAS